MWIILALLSSLFNGLNAFVFKVNTVKKGSFESLLLGFYLAGTFGFLIVSCVTNAYHFSLNIIIAGIVIGLASGLSNLLYSKAIQVGPVGLTTMAAYSHVVLIIIISLYYYGERLTNFELIGVLFILISIFILPFDPNQALRIHNRQWYLLISIIFLLFFIRTGGLKITEEMKINNTSVLLISYFVSLIYFSIQRLISKIKYTDSKRRTGMLLGLMSGALSFGAFQTYTFALVKGPASIISPIFTASSIIVVLLSLWVYNERPSLFQNLAFCLLFMGILCFLI